MCSRILLHQCIVIQAKFNLSRYSLLGPAVRHQYSVNFPFFKYNNDNLYADMHISQKRDQAYEISRNLSSVPLFTYRIRNTQRHSEPAVDASRQVHAIQACRLIAFLG